MAGEAGVPPGSAGTVSGTFSQIDRCRVCRHAPLETVLSLGPLPHADGFVRSGRAHEPDLVYPTTVVACPDCSLLQLLEDVPAAALFDEDYVYRSSVSPRLVASAAENVAHRATELRLGEADTVLEIASNDGYLLQHVVAAGIEALGVEPVSELAAEARARGVPTRQAFFGADLAAELAAEGLSTRLIVANNVLAHVPDLDGFVAGLAALLAPGGLISVEVPYVLDLLDRLAFDTIYHQHRCYFSVTALVALFARHDLTVATIAPLDLHGGSLRLTVGRSAASDGSTRAYLRREAALGLPDPQVYRPFASRVGRAVEDLRERVAKTVAQHGPMAAYGAAAKGTVLLNVAGLGPEQIAYVVDGNPTKHGRLIPGVRVPIEPVERLVTDRPPHTLLLAWNFREEIERQQQAYLAGGGRFVLPLGEPSDA